MDFSPLPSVPNPSAPSTVEESCKSYPRGNLEVEISQGTHWAEEKGKSVLGSSLLLPVFCIWPPRVTKEEEIFANT